MVGDRLRGVAPALLREPAGLGPRPVAHEAAAALQRAREPAGGGAPRRLELAASAASSSAASTTRNHDVESARAVVQEDAVAHGPARLGEPRLGLGAVLVQDLARLGVRLRVRRGRLQGGQRPERRPRHLGRARAGPAGR